jgi:ABC-type phosphate/phosphonate transport system ATPase subunit
MNKSEKIKEIIAQRQPLAQKLTAVEQNLNHLLITWHKLENYRNQLQEKTQDEKILGKLQEINFSDSKTKIEQSLEKLSKLSSRFQRSTLNIGVVGRARQGKSRLLQSITGLVSGEIPDGSHQHCTGVRSTIHHNPHVETYGEVWFYTERTFLNEIISPYYRDLKLGEKPISVQDFANNP